MFVFELNGLSIYVVWLFIRNISIWCFISFKMLSFRQAACISVCRFVCSPGERRRLALLGSEEVVQLWILMSSAFQHHFHLSAPLNVLSHCIHRIVYLFNYYIDLIQILRSPFLPAPHRYIAHTHSIPNETRNARSVLCWGFTRIHVSGNRVNWIETYVILDWN